MDIFTSEVYLGCIINGECFGLWPGCLYIYRVGWLSEGTSAHTHFAISFGDPLICIWEFRLGFERRVEGSLIWFFCHLRFVCAQKWLIIGPRKIVEDQIRVLLVHAEHFSVSLFLGIFLFHTYEGVMQNKIYCNYDIYVF